MIELRRLKSPISAVALAVIMLATPAVADSELYTFHCLDGCPIGAPATNDTIVREIYTLSSNDITKMADWVAYQITPQTIAESKGERDYQVDPWLDPDETLMESQYAGASAALHIDHGHQAPLAALSGTPQWADTNFNSNMTPQASALNQGAWQRLERWERSATLATNGPLYVITGPLFERMMRPLPAGPAYHRVPSGYWKIIALQDGRVSAFIMDQNTPRSGKHCDYRVALLQVELRSQLRFFPHRQASSSGALDDLLGCNSPAPQSEPPAEITTR